MDICGLRVDGRRPGEVRRVRAQLGCVAGGDGGFGGGAGGGPPPSDGSAVLRQGGTLVLASVSGPCSRPGAADGAPAALDVELSLAAFATPERRLRRRGDRRVAEVEAAARAAFESVLELKLYPRAVITLRVAVLQADGGLLAGGCQRARSGARAARTGLFIFIFCDAPLPLLPPHRQPSSTRACSRCSTRAWPCATTSSAARWWRRPAAPAAAAAPSCSTPATARACRAARK